LLELRFIGISRRFPINNGISPQASAHIDILAADEKEEEEEQDYDSRACGSSSSSSSTSSLNESENATDESDFPAASPSPSLQVGSSSSSSSTTTTTTTASHQSSQSKSQSKSLSMLVNSNNAIFYEDKASLKSLIYRFHHSPQYKRQGRLCCNRRTRTNTHSYENNPKSNLRKSRNEKEGSTGSNVNKREIVKHMPHNPYEQFRPVPVMRRFEQVFFNEQLLLLNTEAD